MRSVSRAPSYVFGVGVGTVVGGTAVGEGVGIAGFVVGDGATALSRWAVGEGDGAAACCWGGAWTAGGGATCGPGPELTEGGCTAGWAGCSGCVRGGAPPAHAALRAAVALTAARKARREKG